MRLERLWPGLCLMAVLTLCACVDSDYDLSDVDTTAAFQATSLVLPINLEEVTLEAMLDLDDDSDIELVNGEYALVESGTYESDPIEVPSFTAVEIDIDPIENELHLVVADEAAKAKAAARASSSEEDLGELLFYYEFTVDQTDIMRSSDEVDDAIISLERIFTDGTSTNVLLEITGLEGIVNELCVESFTLDFIKGLTCTSLQNCEYDSSTGIISATSEMTTDHAVGLSLVVTEIDTLSGMYIDDNHHFQFENTAVVTDGFVAVYESQITDAYRNSDGSVDMVKLNAYIPDVIDYRCQPQMEDIEVIAFTGEIEYQIEELNIDPVSLTSIPDVLSQTGTSLSLENPQIYLQLNNPVYDNGAYAQTGLTLTAMRDSGEDKSFVLDEELIIDEPDNYYCLSPSDPGIYYSGRVEGDDGDSIDVDFAASEHVTFSTLGDILAGEKIPDQVDIEVTDPRLPIQHVEVFPLNTDLSSVSGVYVLFAPLEFTDETRIVYTDTLDDWNDEDVDAITITELVVEADVYTDIPCTLDFTIYPISVGAQKMYNDGVVVSGSLSDVLVSDTETPIVITVTGTVTHLDGILLEARVSGESGGGSLKADQVIRMKNVSATVSGSYEKEL